MLVFQEDKYTLLKVELLVGYIRCCQVTLWQVSSGQLYVSPNHDLVGYM